MKYLLDTSVIIDLMRKRSENVYRRLREVGVDECCISAETVFELYAGAYSQKKDTGTELAKVDSVLARITVANPADLTRMREAGLQKALLEGKGCTIEDTDIMIASTAKVNGLVLVTSNEKHQGRIAGLLTENWRIH